MPTIARRIPASLALAFALTAALPTTAAVPPAQGVSAPQRVPYPAIDPAFSRPDGRRMPSRATLRAFLVELEQTKQVNAFCFVQQSVKQRPDEKGESVVWMIWHEWATIQDVNTVRHGQRYEPDPALDDATRGRSMASASGIVNIKTDVVPTEEDIRGSTSLVSRPWADRLLMQCKRVGTQVRIAAFKPPVPRHSGSS
ncbi:hypothetical protein [Acidovorax sp. NCPPB 3576]|uniref:hypothetical protein n=1 Tax=Acidovorax sp. NCPPB 3576 TaxID=2940488 RepID=UPI00234AE4E5|nr:hypothetical protein [Acidovorax sp. NCPPB 3576]WCM88656.1 hypothetical protein M5C98_00925 [Acidovorax sp. NCPPB 3576]